LRNLETIKNTALDTIEKEINAIKGLRNSVNDDFVRCAEHIFGSKGRVIITGIGKSAIIGNKIVSTLNSTGTPSIFMHAADAIHGDLGIIMEEDTIMCISKSGETPEIKVLVPLLRNRKNILIAMVGNVNSYLARQADYVIDTTVEAEACPNNLAPTSSTTAQLVMGDALAVCLLKMRGFTEKDFARFHPGGSLGKRLYMKVSDIYIRNEAPKVDIEADLRTVIVEISSKRLGASIVTENGKLAGIITDGDLRRLLMKTTRLDNVRARDIMSHNPKVIDAGSLVVHALDIMRQNNITQLAVMDNNEYVGVIHLHDIIKEGII